MKKIVPLLLLLGCVVPTFLHITITFNNNINVNKGSKKED